ncbi:hypothetical protein BV25DRAFT_1843433 [Artomyces pyxidatus]|uniref:Uncharacterized protein n=1 Tax=Artomyces pyxidatus TaxID=48021 RepID=A0ACB8SEX8_9AGAM|nr:hypothetical protein BV25DRAFT_1843433 [Artomyces pyxidatus]
MRLGAEEGRESSSSSSTTSSTGGTALGAGRRRSRQGPALCGFNARRRHGSALGRGRAGSELIVGDDDGRGGTTRGNAPGESRGRERQGRAGSAGGKRGTAPPRATESLGATSDALSRG